MIYFFTVYARSFVAYYFYFAKPHNEFTTFTKIFYTHHEKYFSKYRILF